MLNMNELEFWNIVLTSAAIPMGVSIVTTAIYNKLYFKLNKNRLQEELRSRDSPQVSLYPINS